MKEGPCFILKDIINIEDHTKEAKEVIEVDKKNEMISSIGGSTTFSEKMNGIVPLIVYFNNYSFAYISR